MYFYLGLLNSKLLNFIFSSKSGNTQVSANELNSLPYPSSGMEEISGFVSIHVNNLKDFQDELDKLVCILYGLTEEETKFILNY